MILLSHPKANDNVRHVARALNRAGVLGEFWTCSAEHSTPYPLPLTSTSLFDGEPQRVASEPLRSPPPGVRNGARSGHAAHELNFDAACRSLDRTVSTRLASEQFKGVYAYEGGADESFRAAGRLGMLRIYDLPDGHWQAERAICEEEAALEPEWASTLDWPRAESHVTARRDSELQQADLVFVASTFLLQTLDEVATLPATVAVLPPSTPALADTTLQISAPATPGKLRVLFVGHLGQRKGLSYLFHACRELRSAVNLTVIGAPPAKSSTALERELRDVRWRALASSDEIRAEMSAHDVLLAPSVFDGFDPILLDAMAAGLPIIATPHTAAPDLLDHGVEGFIVPPRSTEEIVAKLDLLRREPDRLAEMSANARRRAQRHSWENYERALAASVATALTRR